MSRATAELRSVFGHSEFRHVQQPVVRAVLGGRDLLAILPTGSGKSACFQIPALLDSRLTVVVSPLISLMEDQVTGLIRHGVPAASLTSGTSPAGRRLTLDRVHAGDLRLLYVSPEGLQSTVGAALRTVPLARVVVDEAHCVSEWGHDFRPDYRRIVEFFRARGGTVRPPVAALTATATPVTRADITAVLELRDPVLVCRPVDRPNLRWHAVRTRRLRDSVERAVAHVRACRGATIVYVSTRNRADRLAAAFRRRGTRCASYHAGLPGPDRTLVQRRFLDGELRVVCATNAFGMGIDHSSVRLVCHVGLPSSLEGYVQEAGRAGRDGAVADCRLYACPEDRRIQLALIRAGRRGENRRRARTRLAAMEGYVRARGCRRIAIARYFGDPVPACDGCDGCESH